MGVVVNVDADFRSHSSLLTVLQMYIRRFPISFECCMLIFRNKARTILANFFCYVQTGCDIKNVNLLATKNY